MGYIVSMGPSGMALVGILARCCALLWIGNYPPIPKKMNGFGIGMLAQPAALNIIIARQPYIRNLISLWLKFKVSAFDTDYLSFNKSFSQALAGLL